MTLEIKLNAKATTSMTITVDARELREAIAAAVRHEAMKWTALDLAARSADEVAGAVVTALAVKASSGSKNGDGE